MLQIVHPDQRLSPGKDPSPDVAPVLSHAVAGQVGVDGVRDQGAGLELWALTPLCAGLGGGDWGCSNLLHLLLGQELHLHPDIEYAIWALL